MVSDILTYSTQNSNTAHHVVCNIKQLSADIQYIDCIFDSLVIFPPKPVPCQVEGERWAWG